MSFEKVHVKNLYDWMTEIYKYLSYNNTLLIWSIFQQKEPTHTLRSGSLSILLHARKTAYGITSLTFRGGDILWNSQPDTKKSLSSFIFCEKSIKEGMDENSKGKND